MHFDWRVNADDFQMLQRSNAPNSRNSGESFSDEFRVLLLSVSVCAGLSISFRAATIVGLCAVCQCAIHSSLECRARARERSSTFATARTCVRKNVCAVQNSQIAMLRDMTGWSARHSTNIIHMLHSRRLCCMQMCVHLSGACCHSILSPLSKPVQAIRLNVYVLGTPRH